MAIQQVEADVERRISEPPAVRTVTGPVLDDVPRNPVPLDGSGGFGPEPHGVLQTPPIDQLITPHAREILSTGTDNRAAAAAGRTCGLGLPGSCRGTVRRCNER